MNENQPTKIPITKVHYYDVIYQINDENMSASIIGCYSNNSQIIIPRSFKHDSKEYIITSILKGSFNSSCVKSIEFSEDSQLQMIDEKAFERSSIESISIPSHVRELKDGWCIGTDFLKKVFISPDNQYFKVYENKCILGKISIESMNYEKLVFCFRDIEKLTIPNFIEHICSYSFSQCSKIQKVEFAQDSKLQIIDQCLFWNSNIRSILIPSSVTIIGEYSFCDCNNLFQIEFENKSKLQKISKYAFSRTLIENIKIPSEVTIIEEGAFSCCTELRIIEFTNDSKLQQICTGAFKCASIETIRIPSQVTIINKFTFERCKSLKKIEFDKDSQLQMIDERAFEGSSIESISIPSHVRELKDGWCIGTDFLKKVFISPDNQYFKVYENKCILGKISIESMNYEKFVFCFRDIEKLTIPNFIEHICSYSFSQCSKIQKVEFAQDSKLQIIDQYAFSNSNIRNILIPSEATIIEKGAFEWCKQLKKIQFGNNSKLQTIGNSVFDHTLVSSISIQSQIMKIDINAFHYCGTLKIIEITNLNHQRFLVQKHIILMIPAYSL